MLIVAVFLSGLLGLLLVQGGLSQTAGTILAVVIMVLAVLEWAAPTFRRRAG